MRLSIDVIKSILLRALAIIFNAGASIILARYLGPERLGQGALYIAIATHVGFLVTGSIDAQSTRDFAGMRGDLERRELVRTIAFGRLGVALLTSSVMCVAMLIINHNSAYVLMAFAAFVLTVAASIPFQWVLQAKDRVSRLYVLQSVQAFIYLCVAGAAVLADVGLGADVVSTSIASACVVAYFWLRIQPTEWKLFRPWRAVKAYIASLKRGRMLLMAGFSAYVYTNFEILQISYFGNIREVGIYRAAFTLHMAYASLMAIVPISVYPRLLQLSKGPRQQFWHEQCRLARIVSAIGLLAILGTALLGGWVVNNVMGANYRGSGNVLLALVVSKSIVAVSSVFVLALWAEHHDRIMLRTLLSAAVVSMALDPFAVHYAGALGAVVVSCAVEGWVLVRVFRFASRNTSGRVNDDSPLQPMGVSANALLDG